jgi:hypothetical protein
MRPRSSPIRRVSPPTNFRLRRNTMQGGTYEAQNEI